MSLHQLDNDTIQSWGSRDAEKEIGDLSQKEKDSIDRYLRLYKSKKYIESKFLYDSFPHKIKNIKRIKAIHNRVKSL